MHFWREVKDGSGSFVRLSENPDTDTAVVFVHGFIGDPIGTWGEFHRLVDDVKYANNFDTADLFFYQYPSTRLTVPVAAEKFVAFLGRVFPAPPASLLALHPDTAKLLGKLRVPECPRPQLGTYKKLVLVGHSLGGVLIRQMVWDALEGKYDKTLSPPAPATLKRASIVLFAPAQGGFRLETELKQAFAVMGLSLVRVWWAAKRAPVYNDLIRAAPILREIQDGTKALEAGAFASANCLRAHTVWGEKEVVVYQVDYKGLDTRVSPYPAGIDHVTVCKPTPGFDVPLTKVADGIARA